MSLLTAAKEGNLGTVRTLLDSGANVNEKGNMGYTPLLAASSKHLAIVKELIARGANINDKTESDLSPLAIATIAGQVEIVQFLLNNGAKINPKIIEDAQSRRNKRDYKPELVAILEREMSFQEREREIKQRNAFISPPQSSPATAVGCAPSIEIPRDHIKIRSSLSSGGFSAVYRAEWRGCLVAFKVIRSIPTGSQVPIVEREVALLQFLRHPRVLILMGVCREMDPTEGSLGLIFELMESGSLYDLLHGISEDVVLNRPSDLMSKLTMCLDIAEGMGFLHSSQVLHRDLKSANILLDRNGRCKIADFGLSTLRDNTAATQTAGLMATPAWTDPESALGAKFSKASDMYSFGVVVWEIFSGEIPWDGMSLVAIVGQVSMQGQRLEIRNNFPPAVRGLLTFCFGESSKRPDFPCVIELFQEMIRTQSGRQRVSFESGLMPSEERLKEILEEMSLQFGTVVDLHVTTLRNSLKKLDDQLGGLKNVFQELRMELMSSNNAEALTGLEDFWSLRMERLESLIRSSGCDEGKIVREMKILANSLSLQLLELELDVKGDPDAVMRELDKVRDGIVQANADHNEEMMNELLEELKRMIAV